MKNQGRWRLISVILALVLTVTGVVLSFPSGLKKYAVSEADLIDGISVQMHVNVEQMQDFDCRLLLTRDGLRYDCRYCANGLIYRLTVDAANGTVLERNIDTM